jgi:hypothetical protein
MPSVNICLKSAAFNFGPQNRCRKFIKTISNACHMTQKAQNRINTQKITTKASTRSRSR